MKTEDRGETAKEPDLETSKVEAEIEARDLDRRAGDIEVYKYYFRSVGALNLLILVVSVLLNVFSASFSRE